MIINKNPRRRNCFKIPTIVLFLFLIVMLTSIQVSATEFDNIKTFDKDVGEFGKITIENLFGFGDTLATLILEKNSDICSFDCSAEIEIIIYQDGVLIDDVKFLRLQDDGSWNNGRLRSYQFYIIDGDKKIPYELGTEVKAGTYYVELQGDKNPKHTIDWQITSQGKLIDDWRVWSETDYITSFITNSTIPYDVTSDGNNIWIVYNGGEVEKYNMDGIYLSNWSTNASNVNSYGITTNGSFIWTSDYSDDRLYKYDMDGNYLNGTNLNASNIEAQGITTNNSNIWVTDDDNPDEIFRYTMEGVYVDSFYSGLGTQRGVGTYKNYLYISDNTNNQIQMNYTNSSSRGLGNFDLNLTNLGARGIDTDGSYIWVADDTNDKIYIYYSGLNDINVNLGVPTEGSFSADSPLFFNTSAKSGAGFNFTNATIKVYNSEGTLVNETSKVVVGNFENSTNFNISNLELSSLTWNVLWCVDDLTEVVCDYADNNKTLNYGININSETFNAKTTEGATETFSINFTKLSSIQVSAMNLIYNGTPNSFPYSTNENIVISEGSVVIPIKTVDTNVSFYWNILFDNGGIINTTANNQEILVINIDDCSVFTNLIYNFTQYDEQNKTPLTTNNTMEVQFNLYDTAKSLNLVNFSQKFFGENPAQICLEDELLTTINYSSYVVVKYYANSTTVSTATPTYSTEYHNILNETIGNTTVPKNVALYDLKEDDTTSFRLTFRDESYVIAPNILIQIHRQYVEDNDFKIVEIPLTDSSGQAILNLVRNKIIYNFIMVNEAREVIATFNQVTAFCQDFTIGECTIILSAESIGEEVYDYNEEFGISITEPTYDNLTQLISMNFITDDLLPKTVRMEVVRNNDFGNRSVCSNSLTASSGTISCGGTSITDNDQFLFIQTSVDESLAKQDTINLNEDDLSFGIVTGSFYAFLIILILICLFMDDKNVLVISLGIGWVIIISLGLISGRLIGVLSAGIWILITLIIYLWKLNKEGGR